MKSIINTRSTDIQIKKVASDGTGVPRGLEGAVFQLRIKKNGVENLVSGIDGVSNELTIHVNGENKTFNSAFLTTEEALTLAGLPDGTYVLEEVYTPPGFVKMVGTIEFSVSLGQMTMITDYQNNEYIDFTRANLSISNPSLAILTVTNVPGAALPNTGGPGTAILYVLGIILTGAAGAVLIIKRRVRAA
jgi:LPXTG-motif cell wall-anchored protein